MLQLMRDAAFLDDRSDLLRGLFITYNHPRETFCTVELQLVQGRNGAFHGQVLLFLPGILIFPQPWSRVWPACQHYHTGRFAIFLSCMSG
jgi:hypothetical protein